MGFKGISIKNEKTKCVDDSHRGGPTERFSLNAGQRCYVTHFLLSSKEKPSCDCEINHATPLKEGTLALFVGARFTVNAMREDRDKAAAPLTVESATFVGRF